jgi:hypothetical protein
MSTGAACFYFQSRHFHWRFWTLFEFAASSLKKSKHQAFRMSIFQQNNTVAFPKRLNFFACHSYFELGI